MQFIDLGAQRARIEDRLNAAVTKVVAEGRYILGPEVAEFEKKLGEYLGVEHVIACANGTDALQMPLMARGIGPGHAVFVPSFTFAATAEVVALVGAEPVFVDVDAARKVVLSQRQSFLLICLVLLPITTASPQ
jgi:dTDP-4-amino-4,6-dideoxygalactose transaminase